MQMLCMVCCEFFAFRSCSQHSCVFTTFAAPRLVNATRPAQFEEADEDAKPAKAEKEKKPKKEVVSPLDTIDFTAAQRRAPQPRSPSAPRPDCAAASPPTRHGTCPTTAAAPTRERIPALREKYGAMKNDELKARAARRMPRPGSGCALVRRRSSERVPSSRVC